MPSTQESSDNHLKNDRSSPGRHTRGSSKPGIPRVIATALPRRGLVERITAWPDITVLHGPVGSGKTTLMSQWANAVEYPVSWVVPRQNELPILQLATHAGLQSRAIIVDNAEDCDEAVFESLGSLIDANPRIKLVLATRSARVPRLMALYANSAIDLIGPEDLRITEEDLQDAGTLPAASARKRLLDETMGVAVAVQEALLNPVGSAVSVYERTLRVLRVDLNKHEGQMNAAMSLALIERVDDEVLHAWGVSAEHCARLEDLGLASWEGRWFALHPYFRRLLLEESKRQLGSEQRNALVVTAIRASLIRNDPQLALRTAFRFGNFAAASEVALENMVELLEQRPETYKVFQHITSSKLRGYPALTIMFTLLCNMDPDTRPRAVQLFASESLFQRIAPQRTPYRERVLYKAFEAAALRMTPVSTRALPLIRRAIEDTSRLSQDEFVALGRLGPMIQTHLGIGAMYCDDHALANRCFELAYANHASADRADRVDPLSLRGGLAAIRGDLTLARRLLAQADEEEWPAGWRESSPADFLHLGNALLAFEDGEVSAALGHLNAAGPMQDIIEHWPLFALARASYDAHMGRSEEGLVRLRYLQDARGHSLGSTMQRSLVDAAEASLHMAAGRIDIARSIAGRSAKHSTVTRLVLAQVELASHRYSAAAVHARRVLAKRTQSMRYQLIAKLILACVALRSGQAGDARELAHRIMELINITGLRSPLRSISAVDRGPLARLLSEVGLPAPIAQEIGAAPSLLGDPALNRPRLTPRESVVLQALSQRQTVDEIASQLFISRNTVKSQLRALYRKLEVSSREEALTRGSVLGLLDTESPNND